MEGSGRLCLYRVMLTETNMMGNSTVNLYTVSRFMAAYGEGWRRECTSILLTNWQLCSPTKIASVHSCSADIMDDMCT